MIFKCTMVHLFLSSLSTRLIIILISETWVALVFVQMITVCFCLIRSIALSLLQQVCASIEKWAVIPMIQTFLYNDRPQGKVMFSQVSVCPQSASWLFGHWSSLLRRGWYATYWNAFLLFKNVCSNIICAKIKYIYYAVQACEHIECSVSGLGWGSGRCRIAQGPWQWRQSQTWAHQSIIWQRFCQELHENERKKLTEASL